MPAYNFNFKNSYNYFNKTDITSIGTFKEEELRSGNDLYFGKETIDRIDCGNEKVNIHLNGTTVLKDIITGGHVDALASTIHGFIKASGFLFLTNTRCYGSIFAGRNLYANVSYMKGDIKVNGSTWINECIIQGSVTAEGSASLFRSGRVSSLTAGRTATLKSTIIISRLVAGDLRLLKDALIEGTTVIACAVRNLTRNSGLGASAK